MRSKYIDSVRRSSTLTSYRRRLGGLIVLLALAIVGRGGSPAGAARAVAGAPLPAPAAAPSPDTGEAEAPSAVRPVAAAPLGLLSADLAIVKLDGPDPVSAGAALVYTLNVSNAGPEPATVVTVTDTLPPGIGFVDAAGDGWLCDFSSGTVTCTQALLLVGGASPITITVHAPAAAGVIENTATIGSALDDPDTANNSSSVTTTVTPLADLSLIKTDTPDPVGAGGTITYTLTVSNAGPSEASSVTVADVLPGAVAFIGASGSGWDCGESGGTVTCTRPSLAPGAAPDITITVTAPAAGGTVDNTATVTSSTDDPDSSNNGDAASTTVTALADVAVAKTDDPDPVGAGGALSYTLIVSNDGPGPASDLTVTDTLPAGVAFVSASGSGWNCNDAGQTVTCTRPSLAASASAPAITIAATAPGVEDTISNTASVSAAETDPVPANNTDTESTSVSAVADL